MCACGVNEVLNEIMLLYLGSFNCDDLHRLKIATIKFVLTDRTSD